MGKHMCLTYKKNTVFYSLQEICFVKNYFFFGLPSRWIEREFSGIKGLILVNQTQNIFELGLG
jgi:hypothetical protein